VAGFKITIKGLDKAVRRLRALGGNIQKEIAPALFTEMDVEVAGRAKEEFVPVDTGALKGSIHATKPKVRRGSVSVSVVAGGPAAPYALRVHEWLGAGVRWSVPGTGPKYIEKPLLAAIPEIKKALIKALVRAIKKR